MPARVLLFYALSAFFSAFDETKIVHHTGTMICEGHLQLADKDVRICQMDEYISPTKVGVRIKYYFTFKTQSVWFWYFSTCHKLYTLFFISALERTQGKKHFLTVLQN